MDWPNDAPPPIDFPPARSRSRGRGDNRRTRGRQRGLFHRALAATGYVVVTFDNRGMGDPKGGAAHTLQMAEGTSQAKEAERRKL